MTNYSVYSNYYSDVPFLSQGTDYLQYKLIELVERMRIMELVEAYQG